MRAPGNEVGSPRLWTELERPTETDRRAFLLFIFQVHPKRYFDIEKVVFHHQHSK